MRNRTAWAATVTAVGVAAVMPLAGCTTDEPEVTGLNEAPAPASAEPSPTESAKEAEAKYTPEEQEAIEAAEAAVVRYFEVMDAAHAAPKNHDADAFDSVAIDPVKTERLGALGYLVAEDLHQVGNNLVEISKIRAVETVSDPEEFVYPEVYFDVCVDSSNVDLIDSAGASVPSEVDARQSAVIGAYEEPGEGWLVHHEEYKEEGEACTKR